MLMASQQGIGQNADGVRSSALARMLMAFAAGVVQHADGVASGRSPEC